MTVLVIMLLPVACKPIEAPQADGVRGKITIGVLEAFSGPTGSTSIALREGTEDAVRYVNERMGGISGHPLDIIVVDCKLEIGSITSGWDRLEGEGVPAIISGSLGAFPIVPELGQKSRIPLVVSTTGNVDWLFPKEPIYVFATMPVSMTFYDVVCDLIEKDWAKKGETRSPRVGFDVISMGVWPQYFGKAARMYTEKRGWEHLVVNSPINPADVTTQVLQMKQFGADYIYMTGTEAAGITWIKELDRQNFHPIIYATSYMASNESLNALGSLINGIRMFQMAPVWTNTDEPIIDLLHELNAEWHPELTYRVPHYMRGFGHAFVLAEALKRAVESVGYENIDGKTVKEAMETINDFRPAGMRIGYTWTPIDHQGIRNTRWYEWTDEILIPITDWITHPSLPEEQQTADWWSQD